jgi:Tfp pilus assembly protein PilO
MLLTTPMKIVIAVLLILGIGFGFYIGDYKDKFDQIDQKQKELAAANQELERIKIEIQELPKVNALVEEKERELNLLVQNRTHGGQAEKPEMFVANYIAEIERMVVAHQQATNDDGFDIVSITPGAAGAQAPAAPANGAAPPPGGDGGAATPEALQGFPTRVFSMQMTGRYQSLVEFLYLLGAMKLDRLVTINKISLSPTKVEGNASPILTVQIPITAYLKTGN